MQVIVIFYSDDVHITRCLLATITVVVGDPRSVLAIVKKYDGVSFVATKQVVTDSLLIIWTSELGQLAYAVECLVVCPGVGFRALA